MPGEKGKVASLFMATAGIALGPAFGGAVAGWFGVRAVFAAFVPLYALLAASVPWRNSAQAKRPAVTIS